MNKYGTIKSCPKCGEKDIHTAYMPEKSYSFELGMKPVITQMEHMKRECTNCHYATKEIPLDSKEEK